jgi:hypothetical protein
MVPGILGSDGPDDFWLDCRRAAMDHEQPPAWPEALREDVPDWWPYAAEFPHWHVWRGVCGLVYARRPRISPPVVVRGEDAVDLRDQIRRAESKLTDG